MYKIIMSDSNKLLSQIAEIKLLLAKKEKEINALNKMISLLKRNKFGAKSEIITSNQLVV